MSLPSEPLTPSAAGRLTYRGMVYPWHCDHMGHMNVMWYVNMFDQATWHLFAAMGLTPAYLRGQQRGMAAVEQQIDYRRELLAGDLVSIRSRVLELRDKSVRIAHEMTNDANGEAAAASRITGVHLDTGLRRAVAFAPEIAATTRALLGDPAAS